jgi:uncharacterized protein
MTKYLLIATLVLVAWFVWRAQKVRPNDAAPPPPRGGRTPALPQEMVRCQVCSVHLPRTDALAGPSGHLYCCPEHRAAGGN